MPAEDVPTGAPKTSLLDTLIADDLASGHAVLLIPPDRQALAAELWRAYDAGAPPDWLPHDISVVIWNAPELLGADRLKSCVRGGLSQEQCTYYREDKPT